MTAAFMLGWSSILTGLNFVTTVHTLRAPQMGWFKMPLFIWSLYATGWVQILATPVIGITLVLVLLERFTGVAIFDPARGGDPRPVSAPVLDLLAPGRVHHDPAGHGRGVGDHPDLLAKDDLRLQVHRVLVGGDRLDRLAGLGPPHVHLGHGRRGPRSSSRS